MASETSILRQRIIQFTKQHDITVDEVAEMSGVAIEKVRGWLEGGRKAQGAPKAAVLALLDGGSPTKVAATPIVDHPADEFITDEVVITRRTFKLTHEALCKLLGLPPAQTELEILECDRRKVTLPMTVMGQVRERGDEDEVPG